MDSCRRRTEKRSECRVEDQSEKRVNERDRPNEYLFLSEERFLGESPWINEKEMSDSIGILEGIRSREECS